VGTNGRGSSGTVEAAERTRRQEIVCRRLDRVEDADDCIDDNVGTIDRDVVSAVRDVRVSRAGSASDGGLPSITHALGRCAANSILIAMSAPPAAFGGLALAINARRA